MQRNGIGICVFVTIAAGAQNLEKFSGTWRVNDASSHEKAVPVKIHPRVRQRFHLRRPSIISTR